MKIWRTKKWQLYQENIIPVFKSDNHLLYDTPKDMADEFKKEFGELLPKNFDYIKNLAVYDYIYYSYKKEMEIKKWQQQI